MVACTLTLIPILGGDLDGWTDELGTTWMHRAHSMGSEFRQMKIVAFLILLIMTCFFSVLILCASYK